MKKDMLQENKFFEGIDISPKKCYTLGVMKNKINIANLENGTKVKLKLWNSATSKDSIAYGKVYLREFTEGEISRFVEIRGNRFYYDTYTNEQGEVIESLKYTYKGAMKGRDRVIRPTTRVIRYTIEEVKLVRGRR